MRKCIFLLMLAISGCADIDPKDIMTSDPNPNSRAINSKVKEVNHGLMDRKSPYSPTNPVNIVLSNNPLNLTNPNRYSYKKK
jgi:hypothetical protein